MENILLPVIIILISSIIQSTAGFGFALISMPLLSFYYDIKIVVPLIIICSTLTNIGVVLTTIKYLRLKKIWILILFGLLATPIGVFLLNFINSNYLKIFVGIFILSFAIILLKGIRIKIKDKNIAYCATGIFSGVLNGSTSMSGPPIVLFLSNEGYDKNSFRANITGFAIIINIVTIILLILQSNIKSEVIYLTTISIAPLVVGSIIGTIIIKHFKELHFKRFIIAFISILAVVTIFKSILEILF
jgi:uncharacterized protein